MQKNVTLLNCYNMKCKKFRLMIGLPTCINSACTVFSSISPKVIQAKHWSQRECFPKPSAQCSERVYETDRMFQNKKKTYHQVCIPHGVNCECHYQVWSPGHHYLVWSQQAIEHAAKNDQKVCNNQFVGKLTRWFFRMENKELEKILKTNEPKNVYYFMWSKNSEIPSKITRQV